MNVRRLAVAAVVAWLADSLYGFLVFGLALNDEFARYPAVFRSFAAVNSMLPLMLSASLVAMFLLAYIFAKGHERGPGLQEGLRFGIVIGLWMVFSFGVGQYVIYNYGRRLAVETAVATFVEAVMVGTIFGLLYVPSGATARKAATV